MPTTVEQIRKLTVVGSEQGLDQVKAKIDAISGAQQRAAATSETMSKSTLSVQREFDRFSRSVDPVAKAVANHERAMRLAAAATLENSANLDQATRNVLLMKQRVDQAIESTRNHSNVVALNSYALKNLGFQLNDAATMALSGSSAFQILATQGGQVYQALQGPQGVTGSLKELAAKMGGMATTSRLALGGVAAIATGGYLAWSQFDDKLQAVQRSLNGIGRASGMTASALADNAVRLSSSNMLSIGENLRGTAALTGAGLRGTTIGPALATARPYARAFGLSTEDAIAEITRGLSDPSGIGEFSKRLGDLGIETELQVRRLRSLGDYEGAQLLALRRVNEILAQTAEKTSTFGQAVNAAGNFIPNLWARLGKEMNRGLFPTNEDLLKSRMSERRDMDSFTGRLIVPDWMRARKGNQILESWGPAMDDAAKALIAQKSADDAPKDRLKKAIDSINEIAALDARSLTTRSQAEKLAIEQRKLAIEVENQQRDASKLNTDQERLRTLAIAEATRALSDYRRQIADQAYVAAGMTPVEKQKRQTEIDQRNVREQSDVLSRGAPAATAAATATVAGTQGLADEFRKRLEGLIAAVPGLVVTSGYRSKDDQARIYAERPGYAARPGTSNHERGLAADIGPRSLLEEAHRLAPKFGLAFPLKDRSVRPEAWHVEMARNAGSNPTVNVGGPGLIPSVDSVQNKRNDLFVQQTIFDAKMATEAMQRSLQANASAFGKSTYEIAASTEKVRLQNILYAQGLDPMGKYSAAIEEQAKRAGAAAAAAERQAEAQRKIIESMDAVRDSTRDLISGPLKALAHREKPAEALKQSALRIGDRLIDSGTNTLTDMLWDKQGKGPGGWLGGMLSGILGTGKSTASMDVQAGVVNVNGGLAGGLGDLAKGAGSDSSSFLSRAFYAVFGGGTGGLYAAGAPFYQGRVVPFAMGGLPSGVTTGPMHFPMANGKVGLAGEAGAEGIFPLARTADGKLGVRAAMDRGSSGSAPAIHFSGGVMNVTLGAGADKSLLPEFGAMMDQRDERLLADFRKEIIRNLGGFTNANVSRFAG